MKSVLDMDMVMSLAPRINHIFVYIAPTSGTNDVLAALSAAAEEDQAQVVSSSYGVAETCRNSPTSSASTRPSSTSQEQIYERMAAQGQSLFVAAGDSGAYDDNVDLSVSGDASPPTCHGGRRHQAVRHQHRHGADPLLSYPGETAWGDASEKAVEPTPQGERRRRRHQQLLGKALLPVPGLHHLLGPVGVGGG